MSSMYLIFDSFILVEVELAFVTILRPFRLLRLLRLRKSFLHILASMFK